VKVAAINGSPKTKNSAGALIISQMERMLGESIQVYHALQLVCDETPADVLKDILSCDVLLIVFPLYVDSLPSPLIELLVRLESAQTNGTTTPRLFTIVNSGFFEAEQNTLALEMIEHFAHRSGLLWGYGMAIGGGGMLSSMGENWNRGPASSIYKALRDMADAIRREKCSRNVFIKPVFPRFMYMIAADFGMRRLAKRNGVSDIRARPYLNQ